MDVYIQAVEPEGVSLDTDLRRLNPFEPKDPQPESTAPGSKATGAASATH